MKCGSCNGELKVEGASGAVKILDQLASRVPKGSFVFKPAVSGLLSFRAQRLGDQAQPGIVPGDNKIADRAADIGVTDGTRAKTISFHVLIPDLIAASPLQATRRGQALLIKNNNNY